MSVDATYNSQIKTVWLSVRPLRDGELRIDLPAECCTDMSGAIEWAKAIMPGVYRIETYSGDRSDTTYFWDGVKWRALDNGGRLWP